MTPVDGHWRFGVDAVGFTTPGGGGSPPCQEYGYHFGCCVNYQNCVGFDGAYVLNDGSSLLGVGHLTKILPKGGKLLVLGDSLSNYLSLSLECIDLRTKTLNSSRALFSDVTLTSGIQLSFRGGQTCEIAEQLFGDMESFLGGFDALVVNFAAWYHDEASISSCLQRVLPLLGRINAQPGKAAVFLDQWPNHFPTSDGLWTEAWSAQAKHDCKTASKEGMGCLSVSTLDVMNEQGFGSSARPRGPLGFVGACVPQIPSVIGGWNAIISAAASQHGVPLVQVSRIGRGLYSQHLQKFDVLDCSHLCYARDLFAPLWDAIVRRLLDAPRISERVKSDNFTSRPTLDLDFDSVCPSRYPLLAIHGDLPRPPSRPTSNLLLGISIDSGLQQVQKLLFEPCMRNQSYARTFVHPVLFTVDSCPLHSSLSVIFFLDVYYADVSFLETGEVKARHGMETVYLGQTVTKRCKRGATSISGTWDFPLLRHGEWLCDGVRRGDESVLRAVVCEADFTGKRNGGQPLCTNGGALGCNIFPF